MARRDGVLQFVQSEESEVLTSGTHVFGPFFSRGNTDVALMYDASYGSGLSSPTVGVQRSASSPSALDEDIVWSNLQDIQKRSVNSLVGEYQSSRDNAVNTMAKLYRFIVEVPDGEAIKLFWLANARNL